MSNLQGKLGVVQMYIKQTESSVVYSTVEGESIPFNIGDPSVIIDIIRKKIYSHPLRTMVQEYLSNAKDACFESGKDSSHIDITLPTALNPEFIVRDYGIGMSDERVREVFVRYGISTKRDNKSQLGYFGIGSKSGWAYCDSFVVESFYNGTHREYIADIGENKEGRLLLFKESPTEQENGVLIKIPVSQMDIGKFISAYARTTFLWDKKPNNTSNVDVMYPNLLMEIGNISIFGMGRLRMWPGIYVNANGIPFEIPFEILSGHTFSNGDKIKSLFENFCKANNVIVVVKVNPAKLNISANREGFSNYNYARNKVEDAYQEINNYLDSKFIDAPPTEYYPIYNSLGLITKFKYPKALCKKNFEFNSSKPAILNLKNSYVVLIEQGTCRKKGYRKSINLTKPCGEIFLSRSKGEIDKNKDSKRLPNILPATQKAIRIARSKLLKGASCYVLFQDAANDEAYTETAQVLGATRYIEDAFENIKIVREPSEKKPNNIIVYRFEPAKSYYELCRRKGSPYAIEELLLKTDVLFYGESCSIKLYKIAMSLPSGKSVALVYASKTTSEKIEKMYGKDKRVMPINKFDDYLISYKDILQKCYDFMIINNHRSLSQTIIDNKDRLLSSKHDVLKLNSRIRCIKNIFVYTNYSDAFSNDFFKSICDKEKVVSPIEEFALAYPILDKISSYSINDELLSDINLYIKAKDSQI